MAVIKGTDSGTIDLSSYNVPYTIRSFTITNIEPSTIDVTIYISDGTSDFAISALDYSLKANQAYVRSSPIYVDKDNHIRIISTGTIDYYFSID
jgi:hypothetical protein